MIIQHIYGIRILQFARKFIGKSEYSLTARMSDSPEKFNCSSFIKYVFQKNEIYLPRRAMDQYLYGKRLDIDMKHMGCLIFTTGKNGYYPNRPVGHVGIITEFETVIHASSRVKGVAEQSLKDFTGKRKIVGMCSILI